MDKSTCISNGTIKSILDKIIHYDRIGRSITTGSISKVSGYIFYYNFKDMIYIFIEIYLNLNCFNDQH